MKVMTKEELINKLNQAAEKYDEGNPIMSDKEWDDLYFALKSYEKASKSYLPLSPTQTINYTVVNQLNKVTHNHEMLSLDKTKDLNDIESFLSDKSYIASAKMDGLTCSLTYDNGELIGAETRGNGLIGEDILHNALVIKNIPKTIPVTNKVVIDGEIICTYENFKPFSLEYKNPRNFAAGSVRLLDNKECEKRNLSFIAWDIIEGYPDEILSQYDKIMLLSHWKFEIVPFILNTKDLQSAVEFIQKTCAEMNYPIDGVVFKYNSIEEYEEAGKTAHHFKGAMAYKFYDELYDTTLKSIDWSMSRNGILTPVAVFEPIEIDSTKVERASLHNLNIMEEILGEKPRSGQPVRVLKSNMIIPQIYSSDKNFTAGEVLSIPTLCPICQAPTEIKQECNAKVLCCTNPDCLGQTINQLEHFCGKKGLDIKGLSKATLSKLIDLKWVEDITDIFSLKNHEIEWIKLSGFGEKSVDNILKSIEKSRECTLEAFISALGIPLIGLNVAKEITKHIKTWDEFRELVKNKFDFSLWNSFGITKSDSLNNFDYSKADYLISNNIISIKSMETKVANQKLKDLTFVITGRLIEYRNREELIERIVENGGKVTNSVTSKTDYLINNDKNSTSTKNKKAQSLSIPIITEEQFKNLIL